MELKQAIILARDSGFNYVAVDQDKQVFGYQKEPEKCLIYWDTESNFTLLGKYTGKKVWADTLRTTKPLEVPDLPDCTITNAQAESSAVGGDRRVNSGIAATLTEREIKYGSFLGHSAISQSIKMAMLDSGSVDLEAHHVEALSMIAHKIARILNGDPNYIDNWHDIQGYAKLVEDTLIKQQEESKQLEK